MHISSNGDLVEERPEAIDKTRFEGTTVFVSETMGLCDDDPDATYEIDLLENGNLQFVAIEDACGTRSGFWQRVDWVPVP